MSRKSALLKSSETERTALLSASAYSSLNFSISLVNSFTRVSKEAAFGSPAAGRLAAKTSNSFSSFPISSTLVFNSSPIS